MLVIETGSLKPSGRWRLLADRRRPRIVRPGAFGAHLPVTPTCQKAGAFESLRTQQQINNLRRARFKMLRHMSAVRYSGRLMSICQSI
jgi:hypothetical protein